MVEFPDHLSFLRNAFSVVVTEGTVSSWCVIAESSFAKLAIGHDVDPMDAVLTKKRICLSIMK